VLVTTAAGDFDAAAGTELRLEPGRDPARATSAPYGDDWAWVERVRAPFEIDGVTLGAFLDWASRESGRSWRFAANVADAGEAVAVLVHGSIDGLTVEEALSTVLPSCGLRHRVDGDALMIESDVGPSH
jgi:hypothetical protein